MTVISIVTKVSATTRFALVFPPCIPLSWGILLRSRCISGSVDTIRVGISAPLSRFIFAVEVRL